jgi:membrane protease YdiL (CAAX protease family)
MRLNYNTFTGRRSAFVCVAFVLLLLTWAAFAVLSQQIAKSLAPYLTGNRLQAAMLLIQNGLVVVSVLIAALCTERNHPLKEKLGLSMDPAYSLRFLFPVFVLAVVVTFGAQIGLSALLNAFGREPKAQSMVEFFHTLKPLAFFGFALITVIAAPIAEELAFRHVFYRFVRVFLYRKEAAVVVSLVFALFHVPFARPAEGAPFPWEMLVVPVIPLFLLALFLQQQYEKSKSVIPSTLIHMGFNLISVILLVLQVYYGVGE